MANAPTMDAPLKTQGASTVKIEFGNEREEEIVIKGSPEHLALSQEFDPKKRYMYELSDVVPERTHPVILTTNSGRSNIALPQRKFPASRNIILTSQIIWKGQRRIVRYYDGCTTIFADKQPQDKDTIQQLIAQTHKNKYKFLEGKFGAFGYERMLLLYLNICSWNTLSPFRTPSADHVFKSLDTEVIANETMSKIDLIEKALKLAREATETKMKIHANFLGIPLTDWDSGNDLTETEIRAKYREQASKEPQRFIETYGNRAIEIQYYVDDCLKKGTISTKAIPNKATWGSKNTVICDISGLQSFESISQKLFEFSQTEEGADFLIQLKAIYN